MLRRINPYEMPQNRKPSSDRFISLCITGNDPWLYKYVLRVWFIPGLRWYNSRTWWTDGQIWLSVTDGNIYLCLSFYTHKVNLQLGSYLAVEESYLEDPWFMIHCLPLQGTKSWENPPSDHVSSTRATTFIV